MKCNIDAGYCSTILHSDALEIYPDGSINKCGIILKTTPQGDTKRRVIVDAR